MNSLTRTVAKSVGRHFASLSCVQTCPDGSKKLLVFSGFFIEVCGEWFYVTAGHVLSGIREALKAGSSFDIWRFGDQTAKQPNDGIGIPYLFEEDHWFFMDDAQKGFDFAVVRVAGIFRPGLESGGIQAIPREAWASHLHECDFWVLCGIPSETVEYDGESQIEARFNVIPLNKCEEPHLSGHRAVNQFCALLPDDAANHVSDLDGMSGGPVFAVVNEADHIRYGVIGVQSGWFPKKRVVVVCAFPNFALEIERVVKEVKARVAESSATET